MPAINGSGKKGRVTRVTRVHEDRDIVRVERAGDEASAPVVEVADHRQTRSSVSQRNKSKQAAALPVAGLLLSPLLPCLTNHVCCLSYCPSNHGYCAVLFAICHAMQLRVLAPRVDIRWKPQAKRKGRMRCAACQHAAHLHRPTCASKTFCLLSIQHKAFKVALRIKSASMQHMPEHNFQCALH